MAPSLLQSFDFKLHERPAPDLLPSGIPAFDAVFGGVPRGAVTDIFGASSTGRTSLLFSLIAEVTARGEFCALVDASYAFDPSTAAASGVELERMLWIRCGGDAERALQATDLVLQAGGFGLVAMDLGDIAPETAWRISLASWHRFRRVIENTPAALVVVERSPEARACSLLAIECARKSVKWTGAAGCSQMLGGAEYRAERRKPMRPAEAAFGARAMLR